ncbi:MAG: methyltransferase domain-containing protein, partial [Eggerthella lenta]
MPENNTSESFVNPLTARDWNEEWKRLQQARRRFDDASYWDKRSATFTTKDAPNPYVERFLELAGIREGETVFDMGCGTGALSVPLGKRGHKVVAADFSQGML